MPVSRRGVISIVLAALAGVGLAVLLTSCGGLPVHTYTETDLSNSQKNEYADRYSLKERSGFLENGQFAVVYQSKERDPNGHFVVSMKLASMKGHGAARKVISALGQTNIGGRIAEAYQPRTDAISLTGIGVLTATNSSGNSVCVALSAKSASPHGRDQALIGAFKVLGGSGKDARLRATGALLAIQPSGAPSEDGYQQPFTVTFYVDIKHSSLGSPRGLSAACRTAGKAPAKPKATLDGFAFGPSSAQGGSLPAGTTIYPNGSTISGNVGCGADDNLYAVFTYSGPAGTSAQVNFLNDSGKGEVTKPLTQGRNNVLVLAAPPNGGYEMGGSVYQSGTPAFLTFDDHLNVSRTC